MDSKELKEKLCISGKHIGISLLIYALILIFRPGYLGLIIILLAFRMCTAGIQYALYNKWPGAWALTKSVMYMVVIVTIISGVSWLLGPYGFWATLIIILGLAAYRIISSRQSFVKGIRDIERMIWGRPLDRSAWQGKRPPRLKFVLHKKSNTVGENMTKKKNKQRRRIPLWLAWVSLVGLVLIGALAIIENLMRAIWVLHNGGHALYFAGYLVGVLVLAGITWFVPVVIMAKYIAAIRRAGLK